MHVCLHTYMQSSNSCNNIWKSCLETTWCSLFCFLPVMMGDSASVVCTSAHRFDVHRAIHCNIISVVKLTRYTNVSNLFYFGMTLYMFRCFRPSSGVQDCTYSNQTDTVWQMPVAVCTVLNPWWWTERLKHVECHSKIK